MTDHRTADHRTADNRRQVAARRHFSMLEHLDAHGPVTAGSILEREGDTARMSSTERRVATSAISDRLAELGRLGLAVRCGGRHWKLTRTGRQVLELALDPARSPHGERTLEQAVATLTGTQQEPAQARAGGES